MTGVTKKPAEGSSLEDQTGDLALDALLAIHRALLDTQCCDTSRSLRPALGARDIKTLHIVLAVITNWKLGSLISAFDASFGTLQCAFLSSEAPARLVELPDEAALSKTRQLEIEKLSCICSASSKALHRLMIPLGLEGSRSQVSDALLHSCAPHIAALAIRIGWGPLMQRGNQERQGQKEAAMTFLSNLLRSLSTTSCLKILTASGHINRPSKTKAPIPAFVKSATENLYSAQLLRSDAVMALFSHIFGNEEEHGSDLMKKLAGIGHLLSTPPPNMSVDTFATINAPRLMDIVSELPDYSVQEQQRSPSRQSTSTHRTAACFALARLHEVAPGAMTRTVHDTIWGHLKPEEERASSSGRNHVYASVQLLHGIVEHSEPSTTFLSFLIGPVTVSLFTLCSFLRRSIGMSIEEIDTKGKPADSPLSSMASSLLNTWLRLADVEEACEVLGPKGKIGIFATSGSSVAAVKSSTEGTNHAFWIRTDGQIFFEWRSGQPEMDLSNALSSLQVTDLQTLLSSDEGADRSAQSLLSALHLAPSPPLLASLLKDSARKDVASHLLNELLELYSLAKQAEQNHSGNTANSVLYVQHILELITVFGSEIVSGQADRILAFINFALGAEVGHQEEIKMDAYSKGPLADLTSIRLEAEEITRGQMQMDEKPDDELTETALNLLLSLLEGSPDISVHSHSLLKLIFAKLEWHISHSSSRETRTLAKEARLAITARGSKAASSDGSGTSGTPLQRAYAKGNETYHEALGLLQDPILPVRAHGLVLLKELAACGSTDASKGRLMDPALTSAIVDIYIQAIQDDESFLYLNAVKGLAEMANIGGKSMIKRLVGLYLGTSFSREQVDMQLRMGEALLQVVQKLEKALSAHVNEIVHPLLTVLRHGTRPSTLRSSYLSILGTCIEACPDAFSATQLGSAIIDAMLDLLSVETNVQMQQSQEEAQDPTNLDTKLPQLRRAAVLLLALVIRGSRHQLELAQEKRDKVPSQDDGGLTSLRMPNGSILQPKFPSSPAISLRPLLMFPEDKTERTKTLLGYIAQTDSDSLVRHQAQQLLEELNLLTLSRIA